MEQISPWQRMRTGVHTTAVTGYALTQIVTAVSPPPQADLRRTQDTNICRSVTEIPKLSSVQDLARDAAKWRLQEIRATQKREMDLGRHVREPDVRHTRER